MNITSFWNAILCSLIDASRHLEKNSLPSSSKLSTLSSSENSVCVFQLTGGHIINKYFERNFLAVANNESISINWNIKESLFNEIITFMILHKKSVIKKHYCLHVICSTTNLLNYALCTNILNPLRRLFISTSKILPLFLPHIKSFYLNSACSDNISIRRTTFPNKILVAPYLSCMLSK